MGSSLLARDRPWKNGLLAATCLCLLAVFASSLWHAGYPQWAIIVGFVSLWVLIALIWSNDDHNEESGLILAHIMDENFEQLHERVSALEDKLGKPEVYEKPPASRAA